MERERYASMDFEALRAFVAVVDSGSLISAARVLRMARATLRRRIDEIEASAGVPLLRRSSIGVTPTEAGAVLADRGRAILQEASVLLSRVREVGDEPVGELRLMMPVGLPPQFVLPLVASLRKKHPRLNVRLRFADDPVAELLEDVDVAIHFGDRSPQGPFTSLEMLRVREWMVASVGYLKRAGTPKNVADLRAHTLMAWDAPETDARRWPLLRGGDVAVEPAFVSSDIHLVRECAAAGMGVAFLPDARLPEARAPESKLVEVMPNVVGRERPLRLVVPTALLEIPRIRVRSPDARARARVR
jgi:DNA-binding transcriptional LysR family regulator